ncbi:MAG: hypothetical protein RIE86_05080 [Imperialibacter sp.]|uniref:hypothetical protein n=1 Tax=Imperialibacter sp. TaxID=2038411 RepID=UPI0032ECF1F8
MKTIALTVSDNIASQLEKLPKEKLQELEQVISEWLDPKQALLENMRRIGEHAKAQGLTEEKLNELLNEK